MTQRAVRLIRGYEETGEFRYLAAAISLLRSELQEETIDEADRAAALSNLGDALRCQFQGTGEPAALAEAIRLGRAAVTAIPSGHRDRMLGGIYTKPLRALLLLCNGKSW